MDALVHGKLWPLRQDYTPLQRIMFQRLNYARVQRQQYKFGIYNPPRQPQQLDCIALSLVTLALHLGIQLLQPLGYIHTEVLFKVGAQRTEDDEDHTKGNGDVKDNLERRNVSFLDCCADGCNDFRCDSRNSGEVASGNTSKECGERRSRKASGGSGRNDLGGQVCGDLVGKDGDVDCLRNGTTNRTDRTENTSGKTNVLGLKE